ncbi:MAG: hypothetical protein ABI240_07565, partial [Sphingomonas sp.]
GQQFLQREGGVIGSDGDAHRAALLLGESGCGALYAKRAPNATGLVRSCRKRVTKAIAIGRVPA